MESVRRRTALDFLATFENLDGEANIDLRTPDCRHTMAPASMNYQADMTNEKWLTHFTALKPLIATFPVVAKEIFESGQEVTIWATSEAFFWPEVKARAPSLDWKYHGEYIFLFQFNESGDRISRILEFIDSKKVAALQEKLQKVRGD